MNLKLSGIAVLTLLVLGLHITQPTCGEQAEEPQLKAMFVLNFAKLTDWPENTRPYSRGFTIAILGKNTSIAFINQLSGQTVHGATTIVKHVDNVRQAKDAQLLYILDSERSRLAEILKEAGQYTLLTVSDIPDFCETGGMIGLLPVQSRLSFEVNLASIRKARLSINSHVLSLAKTIINN